MKAMKTIHFSSINRQRLGQAGMVSFMVTIVMMLVISLIVIGFSEVSRRNSREALDRQLSTEAYYAAETGINDVLSDLNATTPRLDLANGVYNQNCSAAIGVLGNNVLDAAHNVSYTCLLITGKPKTIPVPVSIGSAQVIQLTPSGGTNLYFNWKNPGNTNPATCPNTLSAAFTPKASWRCPYPVLRLDVYNGAPGNAATMASNASAVFFVPENGGGSSAVLNFGTGNPIMAFANCDVNSCTGTLSNATAGNYYVRLTSIYADAGTVNITGDPGVTFSNAGIDIDATGKAQDVVRRIKVHVKVHPSTSDVELPLNALQSANGICKRFSITPTAPNDNANPDYNSVTPLCSGGPPAAPAGPASPSASYTPIGQRGTGAPSWWGEFQNTSSYTPSQVQGCTWNFGDGTTANTACSGGELIPHQFPNIGAGACYKLYTVTLNITLTSGTIVQAAQQPPVRMPQPNGGVLCP